MHTLCQHSLVPYTNWRTNGSFILCDLQHSCPCEHTSSSGSLNPDCRRIRSRRLASVQEQRHTSLPEKSVSADGTGLQSHSDGEPTQASQSRVSTPSSEIAQTATTADTVPPEGCTVEIQQMASQQDEQTREEQAPVIDSHRHDSVCSEIEIPLPLDNRCPADSEDSQLGTAPLAAPEEIECKEDAPKGKNAGNDGNGRCEEQKSDDGIKSSDL